MADELTTRGIKVLNKNFFNEFTIEVDDADKFLANLKSHNIIGGLKLDDKKILVAATEMNSKEEIELYISAI